MVNAVIKVATFASVPHITLQLQYEEQSEKLHYIYCLSFLMGFTDAKKIRVIQKKMEKDKKASQESQPCRVVIFRCLLRSGMNKADSNGLKLRY